MSQDPSDSSDRGTSNYCNQPILSSYNLSGSVNFSGFNPPSYSTASDWTLNTALRIFDLPSDSPSGSTRNFSQSWWLDTSPTIALSSAELPYTGCLIAIDSWKWFGRKIPDDAPKGESCNSLMSPKCRGGLQRILEFFNEEIAHLGLDDSVACSQVRWEILRYQETQLDDCEFSEAILDVLYTSKR
ncbi:hypothetical protein K402DRAFT_82463 [Aulographum hederae CBS 113979]|uniref:Uncharacterized protein n=1 Tax=Aulographum hederae CBS 113979 TaxID=1176131 RepID=A0A6G1H0R4_9PEZI|nr:hypothetical protein K402DRAFT_82463 [Aulographum hederae CBS 113979]